MKTRMHNALLGIAGCAALLAACETTDTGADLVGTWQRQREDATVRDQYVFRPDGTLTFDELKPDAPASEDHITGTYTVTDHTLTAMGTNTKDGARAQIAFTYYANETAFATQALRPTGAHTGVVGEWAASVKVEFPDEPARPAQGGTATYQFRADGTFTAAIEDADAGMETERGTYREETPGVFRVIPTGETVGISLQMIDDAALVFPTRIFHRAQ
jgi:hypothetical protein